MTDNNTNSFNNENDKTEPLNTQDEPKTTELPTNEKVSENLSPSFAKNDEQNTKKSETKKIVLVSAATATVTTVLVFTILAILGSLLAPHKYERNVPMKGEKDDSYLYEKTDESWNPENWDKNGENTTDKENRFEKNTGVVPPNMREGSDEKPSSEDNAKTLSDDQTSKASDNGGN